MLVHWDQIMLFSWFYTESSFFRVFVRRILFSHPSLCRIWVTRSDIFLPTSSWHWNFVFSTLSRRFRLSGKTFLPCLWVNWRGFPPTLTRKKLAVFQMCFERTFLIVSFCFRSHSRSQVLTANGQFMNVGCSDTVYFV